MAAFATIDELKSRWPGAQDSNADLEALLEDASLWVSTVYNLPDPPGDKLQGALRLIVCAMVKRAGLAEGADHMSNESRTAGPFSVNRRCRNSEGNFFLTAAEKSLLESALAIESSRGMMTIDLQLWIAPWPDQT